MWCFLLVLRACLHDVCFGTQPISRAFDSAGLHAMNNLLLSGKCIHSHRKKVSHLSPALLLLDEIGYLPIDQRGAEPALPGHQPNYQCGSIVLASDKAFKQWATIFNGDSTITSPVLERLLHHAETVFIEGSR
jgi:hypothetical protein